MEILDKNLSPQQEDSIDLRHYWNVVARFKWGIIGLAIAITVATAFVVSTVRPVYRATATLMIEQKQGKTLTSLDDVYGTDGGKEYYLQTQFEILKSRELATRVVTELNIANHPDYLPRSEAEKSWWQQIDWRQLLPRGHQSNPIPSDEEKLTLLVDRFMANLSIEPIRQTQLVKISFESHDRSLTAAVANAMAKTYINSQMEARITLTQQAAEWLSSRLGVLKSNVEVSEKKLQAYREENNLVDSGNNFGVLGLSAGQLQQTNQRLIEAQFKVAEISKRYGSKHPTLIQAELELNEAKKALEIAKADSLELSKKEFKFKELQREVETNRNLYDTFFARIKQANDSLELDTANARVIDKAVVPNAPTKPRKTLIIGISLVLSLLFGAALAFLLDYLDSTFKNAEDVEDKLGISMLGMVPLIKKRKKDTSAIYFLDSKQNGYAEAMRTVRTSVVLSGIDKPHKVVMLTSSVPSEGKSTSAINLAVALAQMERVLLIDGDMRKPTIAKVLGLPPNSPGLSNVVAGTSVLDDCILHVEDANIDVLTAGLVPPNPLELLSSQKFMDLIAKLSETYDRIVIDSPPTLLVSDSLVMSKAVDAVLYVIRSDTTAQNAARTGVNRLRAAKAPLIGVILNKVNMKRAAQYYGTYSSYYAYGDYVYGSSKKKD
ncbi:GumC family protein [Agitococcus lubricus]|uniref:non-specific protein-tyrosine kinase n=1 Tax=Agitococcus lubricus TaxID=1077255 RepID=A0A2T5IYJ6_9GAMM|nr:polysaccharide biosynthesis tyrosine autokinase [Agitococcus lubricus]PTQ89079.1 capsular exopolysaccharide synthesis family protein [Agitococcus lubricus]